MYASVSCHTMPCQVFLKLEFSQFTGSFKERGARNAIMCLNEVRKALHDYLFNLLLPSLNDALKVT